MSGPDFVIPFDRLPEGFAESVETPPARPVEPRPAATVVLMRDAGGGPEALLMRRSRNAGFVPGAYVFPGGRVDAADADPEAVARVDGLTSERAAARLGAGAEEPSAIAYYLAALREAFEETGILVGRGKDGSPPPSAAEDPRVDEIRRRVMDDELTFAAALDEVGCRVDGGAVAYIAHWITPEPEPRRYDTRFFLAGVPEGVSAIVDPREMSDALWLTPGEALSRLAGGELPMIFPTIKTLQALEGFGSVEEAIADLGPRPVPTILPRLVVTPTGVGTELPGG